MAVDPFAIGGETEEEEAERLRVSAEWQKVMAMPEGRRVLGYVLRDLGLFTAVVGERQAGRHEAGVMLMDHMRSVNKKLFFDVLSELMNNESPSEE